MQAGHVPSLLQPVPENYDTVAPDPQASSSGQAVAALCPWTVSEKFEVEITDRFGDKMVVLYKHITEPDSAWQYIHANSYKQMCVMPRV